MSAIEFEWRPAPGAAEPVRVYLHVEAVHDRRAAELNRMERRPDGTWVGVVKVPDDACGSYVIAPADVELADAIDRIDVSADPDLRLRWRTMTADAVPDARAVSGTGPMWPPLLPEHSGLLVMPGAPAGSGWVDLLPARLALETDP